MKIILVVLSFIFIVGCSQTSTVPYAVRVNDSLISDTTYTKSRHNVFNKERFKFCDSREITSPTYISMKFDCGFEADEVEKFSTSLLPMVETIFTGLVNDNRATWVLSHNWCFYFVQGNKGFDKTKSTNKCISFYVSESTLRPIMDVGSNNATVETERQTIQNNFGRMLATSVHEGWHVHSFSNHDRSKIDLFINELQAYTVAAYVELYANLHLNTRIFNRKSLIPIEDQVYLLERCDSETDLIDLLNLNKGHESYTAFVSLNQLILDIGQENRMTALYLDFIWEHLALPEADVVDIYDFIPSCNPRGSDVMVSLQSAYVDYNIQSQQFYFPTTDYFLQQWREGDIPAISICDEYSDEAFPFYTCLANYLDTLELYRHAENASDLLSGFPLEFAPRIKHLTIETDYRPEKLSPSFQAHRFSYDESTGLYKNELGYIGDTASALNVNVESECIEFQQEDRPSTVTVGLYSDQSEFEFCKFSPVYGGLWASDRFDAAILGNSVVLSPSTSFVNNNLNGANSLSFSVPYIFQGGLPIIQMFNLDGVRLNACIDSGSARSFYSRRYDKRLLPREHGIELYFSGLDSSPSIVLGSLGSTHDGLLQCDLILGADTLSKFNSVKIGDTTIEIVMSRKSD